MVLVDPKTIFFSLHTFQSGVFEDKIPVDDMYIYQKMFAFETDHVIGILIDYNHELWRHGSHEVQRCPPLNTNKDIERKIISYSIIIFLNLEATLKNHNIIQCSVLVPWALII